MKTTVPVAVVLVPGFDHHDTAEGQGRQGHHKGGHRAKAQGLSSYVGDNSYKKRAALVKAPVTPQGTPVPRKILNGLIV